MFLNSTVLTSLSIRNSPDSTSLPSSPNNPNLLGIRKGVVRFFWVNVA